MTATTAVSPGSAPVRLLIVNPNTSHHMTDALKPVVDGLGFENVAFTYFTSPEPGISSINGPEDASKSAETCLPHVLPLLADHDAILIACYSQHPLVGAIQSHLDLSLSRTPSSTHTGAQQVRRRKFVTGIFEASVSASLLLVGGLSRTGFGIVSTGKIWQTALQTAVDDFLDHPNSPRFLGCETTGLNASDLHQLPVESVQEKMKQATRRLLARGKEKGTAVRAICLGCAGMVGLEESVRNACVEELGNAEGYKVVIVDGVKTGVAQLVGSVRCGF